MAKPPIKTPAWLREWAATILSTITAAFCLSVAAGIMVQSAQGSRLTEAEDKIQETKDLVSLLTATTVDTNKSVSVIENDVKWIKDAIQRLEQTSYATRREEQAPSSGR